MTKISQVSLKQLIDVRAEYNLPEKVVYCTKCVISNQRPRIVFDEDGVCNACRFWECKDKTIDWNEKGDLLINGRSAMKMRLVKKLY